MDTSNHLSMNDVIGKHYIIVEVLAKDAFEILYLVRDSNRAGSLFILKELFFETFCSRENNIVIIQAEAQSVFYKQKKEIITKAINAKNNHSQNELKIFGYIEENNTVYTIMEYSTDAKMSDYLEFETEILTTESVDKIASLSQNLKYPLLVGLLALIGFLGFMAYQNFNESKNNQETALKPSVELNNYQKEDSEKEENRLETTTAPVPTPSVIENKQTEIKKPIEKVVPDIKEKDVNKEQNTTLAKLTTTVEINSTLESTALTQPIKALMSDDKNVSKKEELIADLNQTEIETFLNAFIHSSAKGSTTEILKFYDSKVEKYFNFNNISHAVIKKDKLKYNKKWVHREFSISDFKVLKQYQKKNHKYIHLETTTKWAIANTKGAKRQGKSNGFMKLKLTDDGLKVVSIYGLN